MALPDPHALRVYVLTSAAFGGRSHRDVAVAAIEGGATAIQLRAPELTDDALVALATELAGTCGEAGVLFVVNDRPDIATAVGAGGAHVGLGDDRAGARRVLGDDAVLGMSVAGADDVPLAEKLGADYLGVTVWSTATKPDAQPGGIAAVRDVAGRTALPVVGIGGIDGTNAGRVVEAGAAGVAVVSAVAAAADPVEATRGLVRVVDRALERRGG